MGGGGATAGGGMWGTTGLGRMFDSENGGQASWLIPAALVLLVGGFWAVGRARRTDVRRAALVVWGGWLLVTLVTFSFMSGIFHAYYTVALAPAIAAVVGTGAALLWQRRRSLVAAGFLGAAAVAGSVWGFVLLGRSSDVVPWLRWPVLLLGLGAGAALVATSALRGRWQQAVAAVAVVASLAGPAAYTVDTVTTPHTGSIVTAGPSVAGGGFGGGMRGGPGGGGGVGGPPGLAQGATGTGTRPAGGPGGGGGGGGLLTGSTSSAELTAALQADASSLHVGRRGRRVEHRERLPGSPARSPSWRSAASTAATRPRPSRSSRRTSPPARSTGSSARAAAASASRTAGRARRPRSRAWVAASLHRPDDRRYHGLRPDAGRDRRVDDRLRAHGRLPSSRRQPVVFPSCEILPSGERRDGCRRAGCRAVGVPCRPRSRVGRRRGRCPTTGDDRGAPPRRAAPSRLALQVDDADHALQRAGAHTAPDLQHAFGPTGAGRTANAAYAQARSRLTEAAGQARPAGRRPRRRAAPGRTRHRRRRERSRQRGRRLAAPVSADVNGAIAGWLSKALVSSATPTVSRPASSRCSASGSPPRWPCDARGHPGARRHQRDRGGPGCRRSSSTGPGPRSLLERLRASEQEPARARHEGPADRQAGHRPGARACSRCSPRATR
nr:hypothetical protein [Angustibacter aerolatus]